MSVNESWSLQSTQGIGARWSGLQEVVILGRYLDSTSLRNKEEAEN